MWLAQKVRAPDRYSGCHGFDSRTTRRLNTCSTGRESVHQQARGRRASDGSAVVLCDLFILAGSNTRNMP